MDLDLIFGDGTTKRQRKRKPGRPKGSYTVSRDKVYKRNRSPIPPREQAKLNRQFAFDWCYRNNFELVGLCKQQFIFRDKKKTWLVYEKPYDEETPYIPSEVPVSCVKDY